MSSLVVLEDERLAPIPGITEILGMALAKAEAGELRGVVILAVDSEASILRLFDHGDCDHRLILAGLELQKQETMAHLLSFSGPVSTPPDEEAP